MSEILHNKIINMNEISGIYRFILNNSGRTVVRIQTVDKALRRDFSIKICDGDHYIVFSEVHHPSETYFRKDADKVAICRITEEFFNELYDFYIKNPLVSFISKYSNYVHPTDLKDFHHYRVRRFGNSILVMYKNQTHYYCRFDKTDRRWYVKEISEEVSFKLLDIFYKIYQVESLLDKIITEP